MTLGELIQALQKAITDGIDASLSIRRLGCGPSPVNVAVYEENGLVTVSGIRRGQESVAAHRAELRQQRKLKKG